MRWVCVIYLAKPSEDTNADIISIIIDEMNNLKDLTLDLYHFGL